MDNLQKNEHSPRNIIPSKTESGRNRKPNSSIVSKETQSVGKAYQNRKAQEQFWQMNSIKYL